MEYNVTLLNESTGDRKTISVPEDQYIFDVAEADGFSLSASCRAGKCITCAGKVLEGQIENESVFLKKEEEQEGFMLLCCSYARSDCTILVDQEEELLKVGAN